MIRALLKKSISGFAKRYDYDAAYMTQVVETSTSAGLRLGLLSAYTQFKGPAKASDVRNGASLAATLSADCGPCVQLVFDMAVEGGTPAAQLALCLQGQPQAAGDVGLGFRFARAVHTNAPDLEDLRAEIAHRFGPEAAVACAIATSSGVIYPLLKRGLGHGQSCQTIQHGTDTIRVAHFG